MNEISLLHFFAICFRSRRIFIYFFPPVVDRPKNKTAKNFFSPRKKQTPIHFTTCPSKGRWTRFCLSIHVQSLPENSKKKKYKAHVESSPSCLPFLCFRNCFRYFFRVLLPFSNVKSEANLMCTQ
jgi:hypothetical protein